MKTIELDQVQRDFPALCQAVASTGQAVVVTRGCEPLVSIVALPRASGGGRDSVWDLRRQFEQCHGALTEDFDLDLLIAATAKTHGLIVATLNVRHFSRIPDLPMEDWSIELS